MLHYVSGPAQHSPVAPIAARIPSSNTEHGPRANAECGNWYFHLVLYIADFVLYIEREIRDTSETVE